MILFIRQSYCVLFLERTRKVGFTTKLVDQAATHIIGYERQWERSLLIKKINKKEEKKQQPRCHMPKIPYI